MGETKKEMVQKQPDDIRSLLMSEGAKKQFALALPKHIKPDRFVRVALTALNKTPKLAECTRESLIQCLMDCSALGIEPDGRKAHLIPYGNRCTLIIDYKGLVDLARRSGEIADIHADVVCAGDKFEYSFGSDSKLIHKPALKDRGKPIAAYSFVRLKDGSSSFEVMNIEEIEAIRKRSKAGSAGPWVTDWAEMAKKTVFRRHSKWLPVSSEFQEAAEKDYDAFPPIVGAAVALPEPEAKNKLEKPAPVDEGSNGIRGAFPYEEMIEDFAKSKAELGEAKYYKILGAFGYEHANQIETVETGKKILVEMIASAEKSEKSKK
jgi:recombination protein RecT